MFKRYISVALCLLWLLGCSKKSELSQTFECKSSSFENLKEYTDFKNNFKLELPSNWKISKHYNDYQSQLFCADTVKQFTETYIVNASYNFGELKLDSQFIKQTDSVIQANLYTKEKSGTLQFQNKPAYFYIAKGTKNGFPYHQFNLLVKNSATTYFTVYSEIYGENRVDERICESIALLDKIEFLQ